MAKHEFQTEVNQLLHLMIHSLYSNKEIFLRELISNASDALDKLEFLKLTDEKYKELNQPSKIVISFDKDKKVLTVSDTGIGMNEEDMVENLGTIAKSGTKQFIENMTGDAKKDSHLIGQFGVGFYSSFMVANKVEVISRKPLEDKAWKWVSEGNGEYEIEETEKENYGTQITLYLRDEAEEFANEWRIKSIVEKYSNHIPFPIYMVNEKGEEEQINKASALWRLSKSELKDEDYKEFYKQISHDSEDPLLWVHTRAEGTLEYYTLFYIPKKAPMDLFRVDYQPGVKLYVKRVFITDEERELLPTYLRFVRGIIDAEDLPLNVSREILQENVILSKIKKASVKKILGELKKLLEKDRKAYEDFFKEMGKALKEGIYSDFENRDKLLDLMLFKSSKRDGYITFKEYKEAMKEGQEKIFYIMGEDENLLRHSPLLEKFKEDDIEVLIFDEEVDAIVMPSVTEYDGTPLENIANVEEEGEVSDEVKEKYASVIAAMKAELGESVKEIRLTKRLKDSPACVVFDKSDPDVTMQQILRQMGQEVPNPKPILEINPDHEIFSKLLILNDESKVRDIAHIVLDQAKMAAGIEVDDIADFNARLNRLIAKAI
ncbi:molecular chaperone HtpG [Hydrogenimonas thermophila]|uniref:molecular chaperone HtpG n=1 Tax=Hydrogenimonas thermophila TaxID=223786 RepID=UPI0029370A45|nr:molecular chaperone HtpG [Hydrogenimonas thermophila]WOE69545.1 molecular chaperone HtpG [Hydrogenimonas thermophila]WOE72059.1 molecular chaperone HtpG [Hydrogenimonas thermophila]